MHDFGTGLGVLELGDVDVFRTDPSEFEGLLRRVDSRPCAPIEGKRGCEHFEAAKAARLDDSRFDEDRRFGVLVRLVGAGQDERDAAFSRRAEHILCQWIREHRRLENLLLGEGLATPSVLVQLGIPERLGGNAGEGLLGNSVLRHVAVDFHTEELGRESQSSSAIPVAAAGRGLDSKGAALVLVEADRDAEVIGTGFDRVVCREQG